MSNPYTEQDYDLWILINTTRHAIFRSRTAELSEIGLTIGQSKLLFVVDALGKDATITAIGKQFFRVSHTITSLVTTAVKKGLVRREKDPYNKKIVRIVMTDAGRAAYEKSKKIDSIKRIMSGLSETRRKQLIKALEIILHQASKDIHIEEDELPLSNRELIGVEATA